MLRTHVDSLGGNPSVLERTALRRLLLVINDAKSARGLMSLQIDLAMSAFESALSNAVDAVFASLPARVGTTFERQVNVLGPDRIELVTIPEVSKSGRTYITRLVWQRI